MSFRICASNTDAGNPGCVNEGNTTSNASNGDAQVLVGFRVPTGTAPPVGFGSTSGTALIFVRSPTYEAELQKALPAGAGRTWVGYISQTVTYADPPDDGTPAISSDVSLDFGLPPGNPFAGPFRVRPVVGVREVDAGAPAGRPVSCGSKPVGAPDDSANAAIVCVDSPSVGQVATDLAFATRDLGVLGSTATASPGQTVPLPFNANLNGTLPAGTTFSVSAATNLPGVTVTPSPASFTPAANASTRITVPVAIPRSAGPGTFNVSVTASLPGGQVRTGTSRLTVRDRQMPVASRLRISPKTLRPQAPSVAAPARVSYRLSEAATTTFRVQRCRKVRRRTRCRTAKGSFKHAGTAGTNGFRFTGFLRNRALKPGRYRLIGTPTDPAKNKGKSVRASFRIKR